jgi:hypothetical protein
MQLKNQVSNKLSSHAHQNEKKKHIRQLDVVKLFESDIPIEKSCYWTVLHSTIVHFFSWSIVCQYCVMYSLSYSFPTRTSPLRNFLCIYLFLCISPLRVSYNVKIMSWVHNLMILSILYSQYGALCPVWTRYCEWNLHVLILIKWLSIFKGN